MNAGKFVQKILFFVQILKKTSRRFRRNLQARFREAGVRCSVNWEEVVQGGFFLLKIFVFLQKDLSLEPLNLKTEKHYES